MKLFNKEEQKKKKLFVCFKYAKSQAFQADRRKDSLMVNTSNDFEGKVEDDGFIFKTQRSLP